MLCFAHEVVACAWQILEKHIPDASMAEKQMMLFTIFSVADINRDDSISFDEFKAVMQAKF